MKWLAVLVAAAAPIAAQNSAGIPAQAERGQTLFYGEAKCGSCHALKGKGTAVGPNLVNIARIPPRAIAMSVRSTRTQYVQAVKVKGKEEFPGMKSSEEGNTVQFYNLAANPPELVKLDKSEFTATDNQTWKHPPASAKLSNEHLADIIAFIRWASFGDKTEIDPSEAQ
jgi:hypothetical protein